MTLKFGDIRRYVAKYASPVSICIHETGDYENFIEIGLVPEKYDDMYLYGIGSYADMFDFYGERKWMNAVEIMVSETPRFDD